MINRYWVSDASGIGREVWKYFDGDFKDDVAEALDYVQNNFETWTLFHDFRYGIELNVAPPQPLKGDT